MHRVPGKNLLASKLAQLKLLLMGHRHTNEMNKYLSGIGRRVKPPSCKLGPQLALIDDEKNLLD